MDKPKGTLCDVDNSVISFTPSGDFFAVGMNELQIRVINDGKSLISFKETIKCSDTMGFPDDEEEKQKTLVEQLLTKVGKEEGDRKTADDTEREERIAADAEEKKARAEADEAIRANRIVTLDEIDLVTEEGFFVDALAVAELNSKLKNAETTMSNNLKSLLSVKQVTVKSNINVGAGKDFECYIKAPTVSGYTPVGIIGYDLVGNWDVWINVSSCYYNSGSDLIYTKGHNFGTDACNALLNAFVLYKKN